MDIVKLEKLGQRYQVSKTCFLASAPEKICFIGQILLIIRATNELVLSISCQRVQ